MAIRSYTRTGDSGTSGVYGSLRYPKSHAIFEALGSLDELNSLLGVLRSMQKRPDPLLARVQSDLFEAGALLAGFPTFKASAWASKLKALEEATDRIDSELPPLKRFILPSGCPLAARLHYARTVCRRAERRVVDCPSVHRSTLIPYLNRLSSYLFARARLENKLARKKEHEWKMG